VGDGAKPDGSATGNGTGRQPIAEAVRAIVRRATVYEARPAEDQGYGQKDQLTAIGHRSPPAHERVLGPGGAHSDITQTIPEHGTACQDFLARIPLEFAQPMPSPSRASRSTRHDARLPRGSSSSDCKPAARAPLPSLIGSSPTNSTSA